MYSNWGPDDPGTDIDENGNPVCAKMYDRDYIGKWYTHPCDHQAQYVCEYKRTGFNNPDPPTTVDPTGPCLDTSWVLISGRCYYSPADYQGRDSIEKNFGPKVGPKSSPRCEIEKDMYELLESIYTTDQK